MKTVTVSSTFQIVIPIELRRQFNIQPGQKLKVRIQGGHIELIPRQTMSDARGLLSGLNTQIEHAKDRV
jgi:AbrB family looped-hinge helix DNA binding protein